ncbi:MAG: 6-phosphofructokinase, partial [Chlamydiales bacterium]|nr:6-phosphofructokinase [Chlamydiales bacterium]
MDCLLPSLLELERRSYTTALPEILKEIQRVVFTPGQEKQEEDEEVRALFPHTSSQPVLFGKKGKERTFPKRRIGVVFSGGQAPGGHNVVAGLFDALKKLNKESVLLGFLEGPAGILKGVYKEISLEMLAPYRNMGGFDLIGSGRTKIETPEQLELSLQTAIKLCLDGLVIIGGDDSNTTAAILAQYFLSKGCKTCVVGVPKTIDGDLKNRHVEISFGFDTACKIYAESIGNIARDALSAKKYYHFIRLMGRSASHVTLECALAT